MLKLLKDLISKIFQIAHQIAVFVVLTLKLHVLRSVLKTVF